MELEILVPKIKINYMKFVRGQDPKETMGIGLDANSMEIVGISEFIIQANGKAYVTITNEERVISILRQLQENKYNSDPLDIKYVREIAMSSSFRKRGLNQLLMIGGHIGGHYEPEIIKYKGLYFNIPKRSDLSSQWVKIQQNRKRKTIKFI